jgi:hypothetical protein
MSRTQAQDFYAVILGSLPLTRLPCLFLDQQNLPFLEPCWLSRPYILSAPAFAF